MKHVLKRITVWTMFVLFLSVVLGCSKSNMSSGTASNSNPLSDVRVRQAIAYAIDKQALIDSLLQGKAVAANALMPNDDWKASGLNNYEYNPEKAKALLKEAKWNSNYTLDVVYYYGDQMTVNLMAAIQQYLAQVGIKMTARKLEGDLASQLWVAPQDPKNGPSAVKWDMAYAAIAALAPHDYYNRFMTGFSSNSHTPSDSKLDALISATNASADIEQQKKAFKELQVYENEVLPILPLYYQKVFIVESNRLDRKNAPYGNEQFNYDWQITEWEISGDDGIFRTNGGPLQFFETPFFNPGFHMSTKVLYDHLLVADESLGVKGGQLAESYKILDGGKAVEFILKDNIYWHDGEKITTEDVKWTFEFASKVTALNAVFASSISSLEGFEAYKAGTAADISGIIIDGKKITFNYAKIDPNALLTFTQLPPLPKKYFTGVDPLQVQQASYFQKPVGSGPFKLSDVKMGDYAVFVPFEKYHSGAAKIKRMEMYPSGESDPNFVKNTSAKKLDYGYTKSIEDIINLQNTDHIKISEVANRYTRFIYYNKFPKN
ncbi:ABC transporter substrate-binding protein [Treponema lecithinolyticum]|uniref:ABC transporter substrate-binding protein n=1 Tax=Treponema lecithinolyticum TaxID=53418 RepID=UPI00040EDE8B|nr:ABC transporter substrate-binding protein [Treponema lecithinolyticum]